MEHEKLTPECCKPCAHLNDADNCEINYAHCPRWREWFRQEWAGIREAAEQLKLNRKEGEAIE